MKDERFDPEPILRNLKDFQRRTVDYVFERLYRNGRGCNRFLVADEVGLGKTLVARGLIARVLNEMHDKTDRIDIVYVCSNSAIAKQNINRLNVLEKDGFALASRLTLLPLSIKGLDRRVNFVSFTPGTTFDLKSRGGIATERAILYRMLKELTWVNVPGLRRLLRIGVNSQNWDGWTSAWNEPIDEELSAGFREAVEREDDEFKKRLGSLCDRASEKHGDCGDVGWDERLRLVGELRRILATSCLEALEPDLVILDEFQRFRNLLDGTDEAAQLARDLFKYTDKHGNDVKVLLLSATPYKMLSLDFERGDDHHSDFMRTLEFLFDDQAQVEAVKKELAQFKQALYGASSGSVAQIAAVRDSLQGRLGRVLCRTERVGTTQRQDAMLADVEASAPLRPEDLQSIAVADALACAVGARDTVEYWKSGPYLASFLRRYEFRKKLDKIAASPPDHVVALLKKSSGGTVKHRDVNSYRRIDPGNARMRFLFSETLDRGLWKVLWVPPSLPYMKPAGAFSQLEGISKQLVFSCWNLVPDAVATICSYEAERRALERARLDVTYSKLTERLKGLLRFTLSDGRLTGMPALAMLMPNPELASLADPLEISFRYDRDGAIPMDTLLSQAQARIQIAVGKLPSSENPGERGADQRWYWAAPALLARGNREFVEWCRAAEQWVKEDAADGGEVDPDSTDRFRDHMLQFVAATEGRLSPPLGRKPNDLAEVLAELAVAGPGTCALRALRRIEPSLQGGNKALLEAAARVAWGLRTLFNQPESMALLRDPKGDESYWRFALRHCIEGNLQALLDEQVHCLRESLGLMNEKDPAKVVSDISGNIAGSLSLRTAQVSVDDLVVRGGKIDVRSLRMRCRFALRFGELKDEKEKTLARAETVRDAFNSPFRPFVLATTSIGQEGLDFHTWCHSVVHWNLPSNPVDLEQREGRVHRYKGFAVRKNIAREYGLDTLRKTWSGEGDPWRHLFKVAVENRPATVGDLVPFWIFETEGGFRVQRRVPILPLCREVEQYARLKRSLALYRLVFGQPRQEDLLAHLVEHMSPEQAVVAAREWKIDLEPK